MPLLLTVAILLVPVHTPPAVKAEGVIDEPTQTDLGPVRATVSEEVTETTTVAEPTRPQLLVIL